MRLPFVFFLFFSCGAAAQNTFPAIGSWREHLPYQSAIDVTSSDKKIYAATPFSLFSVDITTHEVERMSKVSGLSETGISTIRYDVSAKKLFVAYTNSNIDVIDSKGIHNIPELKRENVSGDKTVYDIFPDNNNCYLSCGLGVIVIDAEKFEIRDSWFIGNSGGHVKTNAFTRNNGFFYAATDEGLKKISINNSNPADFNNWQTVSGSNGLSSGLCKSVVNLHGKTIALQNDSLFVENGSSWNFFFANGWSIVSVNTTENRLMVCEKQGNGVAQVIVLNENGTIETTLVKAGTIDDPRKAISANNEYWAADLNGGLSHWNGNNVESFKLNSPADLALGGMAVANNVLYATAGSINDSWNYQFNHKGVFKLEAGEWTNFNGSTFSLLDSLSDFITVAIDPRDGSVWAGSYGGGLLHIKKNNQFEILKQNSPIRAAIGDPNSYRISGLAFDSKNNLWISNFGTDRQLLVLKTDGSWQSFSVPFSINFNALSQIVVDDEDQVWMVSPLSNGLIVFNNNQTIDNSADDKWKFYTSGAGNGNLPSNQVLSIAKDKNGYIWVGTDNGVAVIQCAPEIFTGCEATLPVITEGGFANYLFKGQQVKSIAVDGANRKWIATTTGAWLVSPDGDKLITHFSEDNSPLLSDDVKTIVVNGETGEVFFATGKGIVSFRGDATEASANKNNVLVFPNPVPPGFNGSIAIRGLADNSIVKITETNGRLVYQARSLGGQAIWNGRDYNGKQVASGIYLVIAEEKIVTKIVFISK